MGLLSCDASEAVTAEDEAAGIDQDHRDVTATPLALKVSHFGFARANTNTTGAMTRKGIAEKIFSLTN